MVDSSDSSLHRRTALDLDGAKPLVLFPNGLYADGLKRVLDVALVVLSLPIVLPLIALMAFLVAIDGGQPVYRQKRIGKNGKVFSIFKLRTMVHDADVLLARHLAETPAAAEEWAHSQKLRNDPRVTPIGRFLRASSMDELPQLLNVLTGEMSLVGPRPMMECQRALYTGSAYYRMRPGITGPWQVAERNRSGFAARIDYDNRYYRDVSLGLDLRLLMRTVRVVLKRTGC